MADFMARFRPSKGTRILDVGGDPGFWAETDTEARITILNLHPLEVMATMRDRCTAVIGDGTNLHFDDGEFDIVFSNSVIEHLRTWEAATAIRPRSETRRSPLLGANPCP